MKVWRALFCWQAFPQWLKTFVSELDGRVAAPSLQQKGAAHVIQLEKRTAVRLQPLRKADLKCGSRRLEEPTF